MTDIIIIGAGVTGAAIARELSRYEYNICVLEKSSDVCEGTSKANSGIVHAGYDACPGTLKAKLNVEGNKMMGELAEKLDFPFRRNGSLVLCFDEKDKYCLKKLYDQGVQNGVPDLQIVEKDRLRKMERNVSGQAVAALFAPSAGIVCPFGLTIALAENASVNGVEFRLDTEVRQIEKINGGYRVSTDKGYYEAKVIINAAGLYADRLHNMVSDDKIHIIPRRGEYCLLDKKVGNLVNHTLFQLPTVYGKGVLVTPTVHGNLLVGPNAVDVGDPQSVNTTREGLEDVMYRASLSVDYLPVKYIITSFAGLRAHEEDGDFILGQPSDAPGFFDVAGIESPGLSCAPAIGKYVAEQVLSYMTVREKEQFVEYRRGIPSIALAPPEERQRLIRENPLYANVVCRCELVTEGEIMDAIHRPLGATTLDGIKRRTRAGMGRCQAGFCSRKTVEILARELNVDIADVVKNGSSSKSLVGFIKDGIDE